jgi:hypothetical protein
MANRIRCHVHHLRRCAITAIISHSAVTTVFIFPVASSDSLALLSRLISAVFGTSTPGAQHERKAGVTMTAGDLRIEVSGKNGNSGSLQDSPKAALFGNDVHITGVMLVPNGTLQTGHRATLVGAYVGRDFYVGNESTVTYQSGVGPSGCLKSCDDSNPCTTDTCSVGTCVHTKVAAGARDATHPTTPRASPPAASRSTDRALLSCQSLP